MNTEQLTYLCKCVYTLTRLPVLCFSTATGVMMESFIPSYTSADEKLNGILREKYMSKVFGDQKGSSIAYYISDDMLGFGAVYDKSSEYSIYVGPCRFADIDRKTALRMYTDNGIPKKDEDIDNLYSYICSLPKIIPETLMWLLSLIDLTVNQEILKPVTFFSGSPMFSARDPAADVLIEKMEFYGTENSGFEANEYEKELVALVKSGNIDGVMKFWTKAVSMPTNTSSVVGKDALRTQKNNFIATATVVSRAAISAGVNPNFAHTIKDTYILKCENAKDMSALAALYPAMLKNFTQSVHNIVCSNPTGNYIVARAVSYISNHLTEKITAKDICSALNISHGYLSTIFKDSNGCSIPEYVNQQKINLAKDLLISTDKSLTDISNYLSFSSQSYFQSQFKKFEGCTPTEYKTKALSQK